MPKAGAKRSVWVSYRVAGQFLLGRGAAGDWTQGCSREPNLCTLIGQVDNPCTPFTTEPTVYPDLKHSSEASKAGVTETQRNYQLPDFRDGVNKKTKEYLVPDPRLLYHTDLEKLCGFPHARCAHVPTQRKGDEVDFSSDSQTSNHATHGAKRVNLRGER